MQHARHSLHFFGLVAAAFVSFSSLQAQQQQPRVDVQELRGWADRGDADAQFELGLRLITGEGVKKNLEEGVKSVEKAAKQKHLRAQHVMGSLYEDGVGVKKDLAKAAEWYRSSADLGFAMSQHSLALMYEEGKGVKKDPAKAAEWFKKAADQGNPPSQTAYAAKLERGDGVAKSSAKSALWYLKAAQQDFVPAMTRLANLYYTGRACRWTTAVQALGIIVQHARRIPGPRTISLGSWPPVRRIACTTARPLCSSPAVP